MTGSAARALGAAEYLAFSRRREMAGPVWDSQRRVREAAVQGEGSGEGGAPSVRGFFEAAPKGARPAVSGRMSDEEFLRERDRQYLMSVQAAVAEVVSSSGWLSEHGAYTALAAALERRGIEAESTAVRAGAALIARGRRPLISSMDLTRGVEGRRRR